MEEQAAGEIERIRLLVRRSRGIDLAQYRRSYIGRRLRARMRARGAADASAYARILSRDRDEVSLLLGALSTRVTSFFRDPGLYTCLQTLVFPEILALPGARTLRLWSAGCATGEEAYSLAAIVAALPDPPPAGRIRIIGTDVDRDAI
ncbi:MAG TPA: CheR family methyltransferase, partial [Candidatus Saccharimonadales bacterium]|nr:CheR family methyltransferase [Candidatus Saccharimonadales bacterium]